MVVALEPHRQSEEPIDVRQGLGLKNRPELIRLVDLAVLHGGLAMIPAEPRFIP